MPKNLFQTMKKNKMYLSYEVVIDFLEDYENNQCFSSKNFSLKINDGLFIQLTQKVRG